MQVPHAMLDSIADAEHHRCARLQTDFVHRPHYGKPFISCAFRSYAFAHFVVENLRAAAGQTVKSGVFQALHDCLVIETGNQVDIVNLRRRETMKLKLGILRAQGAQKIFVPLDAKVGMQPALH